MYNIFFSSASTSTFSYCCWVLLFVIVLIFEFHFFFFFCSVLFCFMLLLRFAFDSFLCDNFGCIIFLWSNESVFTSEKSLKLLQEFLNYNVHVSYIYLFFFSVWFNLNIILDWCKDALHHNSTHNSAPFVTCCHSSKIPSSTAQSST